MLLNKTQLLKTFYNKYSISKHYNNVYNCSYLINNSLIHHSISFQTKYSTTSDNATSADIDYIENRFTLTLNPLSNSIKQHQQTISGDGCRVTHSKGYLYSFSAGAHVNLTNQNEWIDKIVPLESLIEDTLDKRTIFNNVDANVFHDKNNDLYTLTVIKKDNNNEK